MTFQLPGYVVEELIGFGGSGEVWRARSVATGERVALKRLRTGAEPAACDRLRREAALISGLSGPHVIELRDLLLTADGPVLVLEHAEGGSLAALLAARGRLDPAEVVTLGVPLARTLADLHARGIVHGDLSPSNILLSADGRPILSDLGVARLRGEAAGQVHGTDGYVDPVVLAGATPAASSDVFGLGTVLVEALAAGPDALDDVVAVAVVRCLRACLEADPAARPTASELATALAQLAPIRLVRADPPVGLAVTTTVTPAPAAPAPASPQRRRTRRRLGSRPLALGAGCVALLACAVVAGLVWAGSTRPEAAVASRVMPAAQPSVSWLAVMSELDVARDDAFAAGDPSALAAVYAPRSQALVADERKLQLLLDQRLVARGLELKLLAVQAISVGRDRAVLDVRDRLAAYDLLDGAGRLVARRPARAALRWRIALVRLGRAWRIAEVAPA